MIWIMLASAASFAGDATPTLAETNWDLWIGSGSGAVALQALPRIIKALKDAGVIGGSKALATEIAGIREDHEKIRALGERAALAAERGATASEQAATASDRAAASADRAAASAEEASRAALATTDTMGGMLKLVDFMVEKKKDA